MRIGFEPVVSARLVAEIALGGPGRASFAQLLADPDRFALLVVIDVQVVVQPQG